MLLEQMVRPFGIHDRGLRFIARDGQVTSRSYDQLAESGAAAARHLRRLGVVAGDRVAVVLETSYPSVAALIGLWMLGASVWSLPPFHRQRYSAMNDGFRTLVARGGVRFVVASTAVGQAITPSWPVTFVDAALLDLTSRGALSDVPAANPALVQFTSGSTGSPRGVALAPQAIATHVETIAAALELDAARDRSLSWMPLHHDMGLVGFLLTPLRARVTAELIEPRAFTAHPNLWLDLCASSSTTITGAPPSALALIARLLSYKGMTGRLDAMRACLCGAERVNWSSLQDFVAASAPYGLSPSAVMPVYGMAEATLAVSFPPIGRGPRAVDGQVLLGPPLPGVELAIMALGDGSSNGRIALRGPAMLSNYVTEDGPTGAVDAEGWHVTNDAGRLIDGELVISGRLDETIVVAGRNVFAEDAELVALDAAGPVAHGVAAFRDPNLDNRLIVILETAQPDSASARKVAGDVRHAVFKTLGTMPTSVMLVPPRSLPRTSSGKVRRAAAREQVANTPFARDERERAP